jgi:predicted aspartyl protease
MDGTIDGMHMKSTRGELARQRAQTWLAPIPVALLALALLWPVTSQAAGCTLTTVDLPVHIVGQRAIATVVINGQDVPMLVDSGAWFSTIPEATAAQLHMSPRHVPDFKIYGITGTADARIASASLKLAKGTLPNVQFIVGGNDEGSAMGLLGRNILSFTDTEYDLAHGVIHFVYPSSECAKANMAYWAGSAPVSEIQLQSTDTSLTPAIVATAKLNDTSIDVLFDTGATTMVSLAGAKRAGVKDEDMKSAGQFYGIGRGSAKSWTAAFARFEIGGEAISNNHLLVGDFELHDADMLLGIDFFGSLEFQVGCRACGLIAWKSSLPAIRKMTVLMVDRRPKPRARRLAAWNRPLMASRKPLV